MNGHSHKRYVQEANEELAAGEIENENGSLLWPAKHRQSTTATELYDGDESFPLDEELLTDASLRSRGQSPSVADERCGPVPGEAKARISHMPSSTVDALPVVGHSDETSQQTLQKSPDGTTEKTSEKDKVQRLPASKIQELTSSPQSLALYPASGSLQAEHHFLRSPPLDRQGMLRPFNGSAYLLSDSSSASPGSGLDGGAENYASLGLGDTRCPSNPGGINGKPKEGSSERSRPSVSSRTVSTPSLRSRHQTSRNSGGQEEVTRSTKSKRHVPSPLQLDSSKLLPSSRTSEPHPTSPDLAPSPMPLSIPLPPLSFPTYLQLELSSARPSPLYIHRPSSTDFPYESSKVKFERLLNFLLLPPQLEQVLWFGALACLDSWLYSFTLLPLRFFVALGVLGKWWGMTMAQEIKQLSGFVFLGLGRMWRRNRRTKEASALASESHEHQSRSRRASASEKLPQTTKTPGPHLSYDSTSGVGPRRPKTSSQRHRRTKSTPSALLPDHKADLLKGLVVLFSCLILMRFDASRMYHGIRGQAAIKLYVIYNVLEVCDRLFSALGQDVFECLFSRETLERKPDGRSKLLRPFGMFVLALTYNVIHSTALFYQVITLNVAVNSYSNALLTLLMSNQFVEIKSTVFKKFEKENLFQLTCADVVERFQLWLMLMIIALRNIVEVGGFSLGGSSTSFWGSKDLGSNVTRANAIGGGIVIPKSFTIFPKWTGQVFGPFLLVLGSEMLVDWLKHAYITKFNNTKPAIYGRFLDVLAKDYYSNAFSDQNLTRRLGLPVIPLSCLFIRASLQTYHMFLATNVPLPIPSTAISLSVDSSTSTTSPATTAALQHFDTIIRRALGRSSFGAGGGDAGPAGMRARWTADDAIAFVAMLIFFLGVFLIFLALKLVLGMVLLGFARRRYKDMKEREKEEVGTGGRRVGGWGVVEVDDDKRRWIYKDDPDGARASREREKASMRRGTERVEDLGAVNRYTMVAKRIW